MKKLDAIHKTSFKEEACLFYQDFIAKENKGEAAEKAYTVCCALEKKLDPVVAQWVAYFL